MNNKRFTLLLVITVLACFMLQAVQVSETQARMLAEQFFNTSLPVQAPAMKAKPRGKVAAPFYVYNNPEQPGWVIIAGDDRARTVLAWGDEYYFDENDVPECVQDWLSTYAVQIANIDNATPEPPLTTQGIASSGGKSRIAPMLMSNWAQGLPFNQENPTYTSTSGSTEYCPTGCVATAMAQILYYYQSKTSTTAIPAYTSSKDGITVDYPELPATTFNYSIMSPWYDAAVNTSAGAQETARLVKYCGQSVIMKYGKSTSSATSQVNAFVKYFGFDKNARQLVRTDYTSAEWESIVYNEIANGRPVYISARKASGGHAFICDGYENGLYHINWGWRGHQNGYFALNALNDNNGGGTGAASGSEGYTINVQIMTGLQPSLGTSANTSGNVVGLSQACQASTISYTRSSSSVNFTDVALVAYYFNYSDIAYTYDLGWGLYDSNGSLISTHIVLSNKLLNGSYYTYPTGKINVGKNITSGTYYLRPICRLSGTSTFYPCHGAGVNYIKATITATKLILQVFDEQSVQNLKINSITTGAVKKVGSPLQLNLGVSNQGITDYSSIYLWVYDEVQYKYVKASGTYTDIAPGASGTVVMNYTPKTAGTVKFKFTSDANGDKELKTYNVTINSATAATITGTTTSSVSGTTINAAINIKNTNTNTYNDYIIAKLYKKEPNSGNTGYFSGSQSQTVYLGYNNTQNVSFEFTNLELNETYFVSFFFINNGQQVKINNTTWHTITSPYDKLDVNQDGSITSSDVTAVYGVLLGNSNRYRRYSDVNNDGEVTASDITAIYNRILGLK